MKKRGVKHGCYTTLARGMKGGSCEQPPTVSAAHTLRRAIYAIGGKARIRGRQVWRLS